MSAEDPDNVPFESVMLDDGNAHGIGKLTDDLGDDYLSIPVERERLQQLLDIAELLEWDTITLSLYNGKPILLRNDNADDEPTLAVAPKILGDPREDEDG